MTKRSTIRARVLLLAAIPGLAACTPAANDAIDPKGESFAAVAPEEEVTLTGTEPFWNVKIATGQATYSNPDHPEGHPPFAVTRFAGNNGLGFSGDFAGAAFTATLTPGECSDGMSDRTYPYVATVALGEDTLKGCGYTDKQPFTGDPAP
jgi:uncharacterized membrane protein